MGHTKLSSFGVLMLGLTACDVDSETAGPGGYLWLPGIYESTLSRHPVPPWYGEFTRQVRSIADWDPYDDLSRREAEPFNHRDLVRVEGERLFTLTPYGRLNIIELSVPDQMRMLGQTEVKAVPFQLHVRGNSALGVFNQCEAPGEESQTESEFDSCVVGFDVSDPSHPSAQGQLSVVGQIEEAKLVDQVLYIVATDRKSHRTSVTAVDTALPNAMTKLDERHYPEAIDSASDWTPSIKLGEQRIYVAGPRAVEGVTMGSSINVLDIAGHGGTMLDAAALEVAGKVGNSWQMDEAQGVLRVVSLPLAEERPRLQLFNLLPPRVGEALGSLELELVAPLRDVRFDGARAYPIAGTSTNLLVSSLDLADPTHPRQFTANRVLWPHQLIPKGDRLITLSADESFGSAPNISLLDVSDWSHSQFLSNIVMDEELVSQYETKEGLGPLQLLEAKNLMVLPYANPYGDFQRALDCNDARPTGAQLIDWTGDALTSRGVVPTVGAVQAVFSRSDRLLIVSNLRVQAFDITDRGTPRLTAELKLPPPATRVLDAGDTIARVRVVPVTDSVHIETSIERHLGSTAPSGVLDVRISPGTCGMRWNVENVLAGNNRVYVLTTQSDLTRVMTDPPRETRIITVDVANAAEPKVIDESWFTLGTGWQYRYDYQVPDANQMTVLAGKAIIALGREELSQSSGDTRFAAPVNNSLHVLDVSDTKPRLRQTLPLPSGRGVTGLLADAASVIATRYVEVPTNPDRVRFYVDRLDVSEPESPYLYPPVNVPGAPMTFDATTSRVETLDFLAADGPAVERLVDLGPSSLDSAIVLSTKPF